ncbi:MAG: prenyltransferase [Gammaproteobacteria bacterium]
MAEPDSEIFHGRTAANRIATLFAATRPAFLTASLLPVLAALAMAWGGQGDLHVGAALLTLLNVALIHSGANVINDYFDARNGTDAVNHGRLFPFSGGSRFIQNGVLSVGETGWLGAGLLAAGALLGLGLAWWAGPFVLAIGLLGGALAIVYSAPPCLACRGLGDFVVAVCFGVLPVTGTVYIQLGSVPETAVWTGGGVGCFVAAILWVNSIPDIDADRRAGKFTVPARLGARRAAYGLPLLFLLGFCLLVAGSLPEGAYLALFAAVPAAFATRALLRGRLMPAIPLTLATHASVCILLTLGFLSPLLH